MPFAAALVLLAATQTAPPAALTRARFLMGTVCEITATSDSGIEAAFAEARRIESELLSTWGETSELARLNASTQAEVSPELWSLLVIARDWSEKSGGAFNPLVRPLLDCWQLRGAGTVPTPSALAAAQAKSSMTNLSLRAGNRAVLENGAALEEGAFGKGYALDRMLAVIGGGPVTLNFGGQVAVRGHAPVSIADPENRDRAVAELFLENASLSTSSGSEKFFVVEGRAFSHLLDPRTGQALPPRGSVSVIAASALDADILSTALYVMGCEEGLRWANEHDVAAAFIDRDHSIRLSHSFGRRAGRLTILNPHFHIKES